MAMHPWRTSVLMCSCCQTDKSDKIQLPLLHIPDIDYTVDNCPPVPMINPVSVAVIVVAGRKNGIYVHTRTLLYDSISTQ